MRRILPLLALLLSAPALAAPVIANFPPITGGGGGGAVSSVAASGGGCVTVSPTTGAVLVVSTGCAANADNLSGLASAATSRTNLGLGTASTFASSAFLQSANNLSDLGTPSTARTNLGLVAIAASGSASDLSTGTLPAGRFPALTGDATTSAGSLAVSITGLALSKLATQADQTVAGNGSGSTAVPVALTVSTAGGLVAAATTLKWTLTAGVSGGQTMICGTGSGDSCTFSTTANATKGTFVIGASTGFSYSEVNKRLTINNVLNINGAAGDFDKSGSSFFIGTSTNNALAFYANNVTQIAITTGPVFAFGTARVYFGSAGPSSQAMPANQSFYFKTAPPTIASSANATLDAIEYDPSLVSVAFTGTTTITNATGVNYFDIERPAYTDASALTITNASTFTVKGCPSAAGSVTITNCYAGWFQQGSVRIDGTLDHGSAGTIQLGAATLAANATAATVLGSLGPAGASTTVQEWMKVKGTGGADRYVPMFYTFPGSFDLGPLPEGEFPWLN